MAKDRLPSIAEALAEGEGPRVEYKRTLPGDARAARPLCAFANSRGGLLLVGVTDTGGVHGLHHPEEVARHLVLLARTLVDPPLAIEARVVELDGPRIVAVRVLPSPSRPHSLPGPRGTRLVLVRAGAANRAADGPTLAAMKRGAGARARPSQLAPLELAALMWVKRSGHAADRPSGDATAARLAKARNIGIDRARRVLTRLETLGLVVGHGAERSRVYVASE